MSLEYIYYRLSKRNVPAYSLNGKATDGKFIHGGAYICSTWNLFKDIFKMLYNKEIKTITIEKY